jgi:hypothetical protein
LIRPPTPPSVVRRPFLLGGPRRLVGSRAVESFSDGVELHFQHLNFLVLAKYHIAQLGNRLLEIRYFRLKFYQGLVMHHFKVLRYKTNSRLNTIPAAPGRLGFGCTRPPAQRLPPYAVAGSTSQR